MFSVAVSIIILCKAIVQHYKLLPDRENNSRFERIIPLLKEKLPPRGIIGYFNDIEPERLYAEEYWRTQYALSPVILQKNLDHHFIIGVLHPSVQKKKRYEEKNLSLLADFGEGIVLLERKNK